MRITKTPELALFTALCLAFGCASDDGDSDTGASADDDDSESDGDDDDDDDDDSVSASVSDSDTDSDTASDTGSTGNDTGDTSVGSVDTGETGDTTATSVESTGEPTSDSGDSSTGEQPGNTIYEVQDGTLAEGDNVELIGITVTALALNGIFVQEPAGGEYSGVFVFSGDMGPDISDAQVGDVIDVSGVITEYFDHTEVEITDGTYVNNGAGDPIEPEVVDIATLADLVTGEAWESVLVRIEGSLSVTDINMFDEFTVVDSGDELLIDNFCYDTVNGGDFPGLGVGSDFSAIQGPLNFSFDNFKIAPRSADDLEGFNP